jgi:bifunctional non-homologous end joining protein LigD
MSKAEVDERLSEYRAKRDFSRTAEPDDAGLPRQGEGLAFVVQKHDATRLHYDFRLEWEGVLKSWAVTRGPSYDPAEKRLAVRTEDHPLAYGAFEGTIPEKEYGGGTVMLWDRGTWEPVGDFAKGLQEGKLVFRLDGERLKGEWTLVRMKPRAKEKRENWLMIKHREEGFVPPRGDVLTKYTRSVGTDRTMTQIAKGGRSLAKSDLTAKRPPGGLTGRAAKPGSERSARAKTTRSRALPRWREPQLATLVRDAPEGGDWIAEMKYDGYRALIAVADGTARIFTRSGLDWTDKFPGIAAASAGLDVGSALIDGEIVAFDRTGKTDFSTLQKTIKAGGKDLSCFAFDLLELDGEDLTALPLLQRKEKLAAIIAAAGEPLLYSTHVTGRSDEVFRQICAAGHEGIIAKRADQPYRSGRGRGWLKVKCTRRQEFVVGGYAPSDKRGRTVRSLLIGVMDKGKLAYKGRVGAFEGDTLAEVEALVAARSRKTTPFADVPPAMARGAVWLTPDIVVEVDMAEFTSEGVVRHGVVKGIRGDKAAADVVLEVPKETTMSHETRDTFAGVKLSSPQKVLFAEQGVTKADLAAHYERVAARMLPQVTRRLLSLVRCPDGEGGQCFFQKHDSKGFPEQLKRMDIAESDGKTDTYLYAEDVSALIAGVQMGTLEFHIWGSRIKDIEKPDRLVFDLDPDEGLDFADVRDAAFDLRDRLAKIGLKTVAMVTGGKGVHVIAPVTARVEWPEVKEFAKAFAKSLEDSAPDRYVANMSKARRKGRIFVDYLRNERGSTAICPWSTRRRKGAPVATPVSWDELKSLDAANTFHIADMEARLAMADPWAEADGWKQSITRAMMKKVEAG